MHKDNEHEFFVPEALFLLLNIGVLCLPCKPNTMIALHKEVCQEREETQSEHKKNPNWRGNIGQAQKDRRKSYYT
jgi:hypothetical protein